MYVLIWTMSRYHSNDKYYHPVISFKMRAILMEWLMEISDNLLSVDTFETAAILVDKCINHDLFIQKFNTNNFQLLGATCLWISSKINESANLIFDLDELVRLSAGIYSIKDFLDMEYYILKLVNWNVFYKTPYNYIRYLISKFGFDLKPDIYHLIFKMIDISYIDYKFIYYNPIIIAKAVMNIILQISFNNDPLNEQISKCSKEMSKIYLSSIFRKIECMTFHCKNQYIQRCYLFKTLIDRQPNDVMKKEIIFQKYFINVWSSICENISGIINIRTNTIKEIESYFFLNKCGEGTFSNVYRAVEKNTFETVAIKEIKNYEREGMMSYVITEIALLKKCNHPNIISLNDVIYSDKIYLIFEYYPLTLWTVLKNTKMKLPSNRIKNMMYKIISALEYCHSMGIIHCDIKPHNILIRGDDVKLCDFGSSKLSTKKKLPQMVTLWYRSPEILFGSTNYGTEIDIWSCGCILAQMYSNEVLFRGNDIQSQLDKIFEKLDIPNKNSELRKLPNFKYFGFHKIIKPLKINDECDKLLLLMLEIEPNKRITANEILKHEYFSTINKSCYFYWKQQLKISKDNYQI